MVDVTRSRAIVHVLPDAGRSPVAPRRNNWRAQHQVECHTALALAGEFGVSILDSRQHQLFGAFSVKNSVDNPDATEEPGDSQLFRERSDRLLSHGSNLLTLGRAQCSEQLQILLLST